MPTEEEEEETPLSIQHSHILGNPLENCEFFWRESEMPGPNAAYRAQNWRNSVAGHTFSCDWATPGECEWDRLW